LGLLFGPIIGALLYAIGNFCYPFWFQASLFIVSYRFVSSNLLNAKDDVDQVDSFMSESPTLPQVPLIKLLMIPRFVFGMVAQMNLMMSMQFLAPTLALHLKTFDLSQTYIGLVYGIPAILYACSAPFVYKVTARMEKRGIIVIGFVVISFAMVLIGSNRIELVFVGLCMMGLSACLVSIPVLPEMLESVETNS
jgi:MFS family permease